jgi:hypothetical protein
MEEQIQDEKRPAGEPGLDRRGFLSTTANSISSGTTSSPP